LTKPGYAENGQINIFLKRAAYLYCKLQTAKINNNKTIMTNKLILLATLTIWQVCTSAQSVAPQKLTGKRYGFAFNNVTVEIDTADGARIVSFKADNKEILYTGSTQDMNGSTFWPSPQSFWNWPPIAEIDNKAYAVKITGNKLKMEGKTNATHKLSVTKIFEADSRDTSFTITYILINHNTTTKKYAPWEVTRVLAEGLTFFGKGTTEVTGNMKTNAVVADNTVWYHQDSTNSGSNFNKFFCDGQGWLAHANKENYLFLKKFENIEAANAATGEAEIEVYTADNHAYTELENQGAYVSVNAGDSIKWKVKWYVRKIESKNDIFTGSQKLISIAKRLISLPELPDTFSTTRISQVKNQGINLYPVPVREKLTVKLPDNVNKATVSIYNMQGAMVLSSDITASNSSISLKHVPAGPYVCRVYSKSGLNENKFFLIQ